MYGAWECLVSVSFVRECSILLLLVIGEVKGIENMHGGKYIGSVINGRVGMIFMFMLLVAFSYNIRAEG